MVVVATWPFAKLPVEGCTLGLLQDERVSVKDALVAAMEKVEGDPQVHTVGAHSFANADGVLQLDAALMTFKRGIGVCAAEGDTQCGAVLGVTGFPGAIRGAAVVAKHSPHPILCGEGAARFMVEHGISRLKDSDIPVYRPPPTLEGDAVFKEPKSHDTVGMIALRGDTMAVGCSTSGIKAKLPGRVGDSPLFGSGLYGEAAVGAAVATGDGDTICKFPLAFVVVEEMRKGHSPEEACTNALKRFLALPFVGDRAEVGLVAANFAGEIGSCCTPCWRHEYKSVSSKALKDGTLAVQTRIRDFSDHL